jgi:hypothetical protein
MGKRFPALRLASALMFATSGASGQLLNGSFEEAESILPNPYADLAASWGRWGNWMNRETGWEPTRSGLGMMGYHHWEIQEPAMSGFYQDVTNVPPGSPCVFGVYCFKDPGTDAEFVELRLERTGGFHTYANRVYPINELRTDWQRLWLKGTNDTAGVRVLVSVKPKALNGRNGALKFDDAELTVLPVGTNGAWSSR